MQALMDCITEIRDDPNTSTWNEAQAKEWIIRPILDLLGWGRREIIPEHSVETQSVDYALQIYGENKLFIESKRPKKNLENYQKQLLEYCFKEGVELAILTNGNEWWFYLPLKKGAWNNRKFYTINILEHEIEDIIGKFDLLLSRKNVETGEAVQQAESILESRRREKLIRETLPQAMPTKRPDTKTPPQTKNQRGKPKRMRIGNESYELRYQSEILINTANWLIDKGHLKPSDCPVKLASRDQFIISTPERGRNKLKKGLYIERYSRRARRYAQRLLEHYGYDPEMLQIEY